jgi:uncharacterized coiled-coil protein SlyX
MMMTIARSWLKENATLVYFLIAQAIALISLGAYGLSYMVKLEQRVVTLETRGSSHLAEINNRLTVTEKETDANRKSLDRIVEIMLRELPVKKEQLR